MGMGGSYRKYLVALVVSLPVSTAYGQTPANRLSECLMTKSTNEDRVALMKWMAFGISAHPAIKDVLAIPPVEIDRSDKEMAAIFTELLVVRCPAEASAVLSSADSSNAMQVAFEKLGEMAAEEIYNGPAIQTRMSGFLKYLNEDDFKSLNKP